MSIPTGNTKQQGKDPTNAVKITFPDDGDNLENNLQTYTKYSKFAMQRNAVKMTRKRSGSRQRTLQKFSTNNDSNMCFSVPNFLWTNQFLAGTVQVDFRQTLDALITSHWSKNSRNGGNCNHFLRRNDRNSWNYIRGPQ